MVMNSDTKLFLQNKFKEYYKRARIETPQNFRIRKREWAFVLFDDAYPRLVMRRHKAFSSLRDINTYLETVAPAHVYHSTAYYKYPSATKMADKEWEAADLIFDLDADQIVKGAISSYSQMLNIVKSETEKLLTFLTEDFALKEDEISVVFSGGRGYHVHVTEERLAKLGSHERREVVNYVTGNGVEAEYIIDPGSAREYNESESCWQIRIIKRVKSDLESLRGLQERDAIEQLTSFKKNISPRKAKEVIENLEQIIENLNGGSGARRFVPPQLKPFWKSMVREAVLDLKVNVDQPVTADIKRLIRFPSSLHGGSGLCVAPIAWGELDTFDPLYDAVVFGEEMTPVKVLAQTATEIKNESICADEKTVELPEHTAIFLMARGLAEYEPRRSKSYKKQ
jgi:DNA primase small subunit